MAISRRDILQHATGCVLVGAVWGSVRPSKGVKMQPPEPISMPNILWISTEDISPDLGCYGDSYALTPAIDRLASEGVRFTNAFSTSPVCAPSRSAIITAMYPTAIGTHHMRSRAIPPPEVKCFPEYLRAAGYYCTNNSKTDYNFEPPLTAWDESNNTAHWRNRPDKSQPFFSVFNLTSTHESQIRLNEEAFANATRFLSPAERHDPAKAILPPYYPDTPIVRKDWARYYDLITRMDKQVEAILKELADDGLAENTVVFFWGDHGRGLPRAKRWLYDSGLRVPLLVRYPGKVAPGTVRDDLVSLMDLGPTVLSLTDIPTPKHMQGQAFLGKYQAKKPRTYIFGHRDRMDETYDLIRSVNDKRFKYIRNYQSGKPYAQFIGYAEEMPTLQEMRRLNKEESTAKGAGKIPNQLTPAQRLFFQPEKPTEELYDLQNDPHEINNLAGEKRFEGERKRLRGALEKWVKETKDLGFTPEQQLIDQWRPNGVSPVTAEPKVSVSETGTGYVITLTCPTEGASIAYTLEPIGKPDEKWQLYSAPLSVSNEELARAGKLLLRVKAVRIGYTDSDEIDVSLGIQK